MPHYYLSVDLELDALLSLRETLNASLPEEEQLTVNDLMLKAAALAMKVRLGRIITQSPQTLQRYNTHQPSPTHAANSTANSPNPRTHRHQTRPCRM